MHIHDTTVFLISEPSLAETTWAVTLPSNKSVGWRHSVRRKFRV